MLIRRIFPELAVNLVTPGSMPLHLEGLSGFLLYNVQIFLFLEATQVLVQSLVISRLDYCNPLLAGLPVLPIQPQQLIPNAAA